MPHRKKQSAKRNAGARRRFEITNPDKALFPADGITKAKLIDYYESVARKMLVHIAKRPLVMRRWPDGIGRKGFFQKQTPDYFPDWIKTARVKKQGGTQDLVVCDNRATLGYLANQACIEVHTWLSRVDSIHRPDVLIFDLDPSVDRFASVRRAARACKQLCDELELPAFLKTTGSRGLHVVIPLIRGPDFDAVRGFAREMSAVLASRHSDELTTEHRKNKRRGRVYLDVARNAYAQTAVAPYSVRALAGAPVATPIDWEELRSSKLHSRTFTIKNISRRLEGGHSDPWASLRRSACSLEHARKRLERMREDG